MLLIKELREEAGLTQKQLAEKICNLQRNISNWETGVSEPDLQTLINLADFFQVTLDELCGRFPNENGDRSKDSFIKKLFGLSREQQDAITSLIDAFSS